MLCGRGGAPGRKGSEATPLPDPPGPAGGGDLAPHPAAEVRARRHPAGDVPAAAAEAHPDPGPPGPSRGACEPGVGGGTGRGPAPHSRPQPLFPCSGGGWRPSWRRKSTAAPSRVDCDPYRCTTAPHRLHKGLTFQTPPLVSRAPGAGWGGKSGGKGRSACCLSHIRRHSQQRRQHGSCNKMGKCKLAEVT